MSKELHHFNVCNSVGDPIRYILHYTKQKFQDVKHDMDTWPDQKNQMKDSTLFGKLPMYKEDGRILTQSLAITKYVARYGNLIPADLWKQAVLDSMAQTIHDFWHNVRKYGLEKDLATRYDLLKQLIDETVDFYFSRFEKLLKENGGYFTGKLSWAEFVLCGIVEATELYLTIDLSNKYPMVSAMVETIQNLPGVKEYIVVRGPNTRPFATTKYKGMDV